ncbi:hypothetical protein E2C01_023345 [Portunus trituberculatus]|uniref:Uncharacterized protein n=1 Tax=Portunus trituberculatus TaxID=210409 RepID=A0A5B7E7R3_PORTR|nr:hypothetical protein [Portunus trituberculatus]
MLMKASRYWPRSFISLRGTSLMRRPRDTSGSHHHTDKSNNAPSCTITITSIPSPPCTSITTTSIPSPPPAFPHPPPLASPTPPAFPHYHSPPPLPLPAFPHHPPLPAFPHHYHHHQRSLTSQHTHQASGLHEADVLGGEERPLGRQLVVLELPVELCQLVLQDVEFVVPPLHLPVKLIKAQYDNITKPQDTFSLVTSGAKNVKVKSRKATVHYSLTGAQYMFSLNEANL